MVFISTSRQFLIHDTLISENKVRLLTVDTNSIILFGCIVLGLLLVQ